MLRQLHEVAVIEGHTRNLLCLLPRLFEHVRGTVDAGDLFERLCEPGKEVAVAGSDIESMAIPRQLVVDDPGLLQHVGDGIGVDGGVADSSLLGGELRGVAAEEVFATGAPSGVDASCPFDDCGGKGNPVDRPQQREVHFLVGLQAGRRGTTVKNAVAFPALRDQPGLMEDFQMMAECGLRNTKQLTELRDGVRLLEQYLENADTQSIAGGFTDCDDDIEIVGGRFCQSKLRQRQAVVWFEAEILAG